MNDKTWRSYRCGVELFLNYFEGRDVLTLTEKDILKWVEYLNKRYAYGTIGARMTAARIFYDMLNWCGIRNTCMQGISKPPPTKLLCDEWPAYAENNILELLTKVTDKSDRFLLILCGKQGLTASQFVALKWDDLDVSNGKIYVKKESGVVKHCIPMCKTLHDELKEIEFRSLTGFIVPYRSTRQAYNRMKLMAQAHNIEFYGVRGLRHTAANKIAGAAGGAYDVGRLLGFRTYHTTKRYVKPDVSNLEAILDKI